MSRLCMLLARLEGVVVLVSYTALIVFVGLETVRRMLTDQQAIWGPELAMYAFIWLSWFAMSSHVRNNTNLAFGAFRERMTVRWQVRLEAADLCMWLVIGMIILIESAKLVHTNIALNQIVFGTSIPLWVVTIAIPLAWGFTMVGVAQRLFALYHRRDHLPVEKGLSVGAAPGVLTESR